MTKSLHQGGFRDLRTYLDALRARGELCEITAEVDPKLELAEIHRRVIQQEGPALLFRNLRGSKFPVVTNLFGTRSRAEFALGTHPKDLVREVAKLPETLMPPSLTALWNNKKTLGSLLKVGLKNRGCGEILENSVSPPKLQELPVLTTWKEDGGPFITLPLVYTQHPETHQHNLGMYRMQIHSQTTTGMHFQIGKGGGFHLAAAKALKKRLPAAVYLGGPPGLILSAIAPLPENVPELLLASLVLGRKLELTKHSSSPLPVVSSAEFCLLGDIDPEERQPEGPFGDHYGYYSLKHDYPVFRVHTLLHRKDAIYPATVVGKPRQEDFYIGDYLQDLLSPLFPLVMPAVKDLWSYGETGYHSLAAAVTRERYKREAMVSAFRILGEGQLSLTKFLLLIDKSHDLKKFSSVLEHVLERADFRSDLYIFSNLSMDTLDYSGPTVNEGSKGVLLGMGDPIRSLPGVFSGTLPRPLTKAEPFCRGCLVVSGLGYSNDANLAQQVANEPAFSEWPLIVLTDDAEKTCASEAIFLWETFTRFEPAANIFAKNVSLHRYHPVLEAPIVIDARMKPNYPAELECDDDTKHLVDSRWKEYGIPQ